MSERKSIVVDAGFDNTSLSQGMISTQQKVAHWAKDIGGKIAAAFAFEQILEFDKSLSELAQKLSDTADRLGVTTDEVQRLYFAAGMAGTNIDVVAGSLDRLAKAKTKVLEGDDANGGLAGAFDQFGISFKDLAALTPDELFHRIGESIEKTGVNAKVTASLMDLLGKSGGSLIPMLKELRERSAEAPIISAGDLENLKKAGEALEGLYMKIKVLFATLQVRLFNSKTWKEFFYGIFHPNTTSDEIVEMFGDTDKMTDKQREEYYKKHPQEKPPAPEVKTSEDTGGEGGGGTGSVKKSDLGGLYRRREQILARFKNLDLHDSPETIRSLQGELTGINDTLAINGAKTELDKLKLQRSFVARDLKREQTNVFHGSDLDAQHSRIANYSEKLKSLDAQISDVTKSQLDRIGEHSEKSATAMEKLAGTVVNGQVQTAIASK